MTGGQSCCGEMPGSSSKCFVSLRKTQWLGYSVLRDGAVTDIVVAQSKSKAI